MIISDSNTIRKGWLVKKMVEITRNFVSSSLPAAYSSRYLVLSNSGLKYFRKNPFQDDMADDSTFIEIELYAVKNVYVVEGNSCAFVIDFDIRDIEFHSPNSIETWQWIQDILDTRDSYAKLLSLCDTPSLLPNNTCTKVPPSKKNVMNKVVSSALSFAVEKMKRHKQPSDGTEALSAEQLSSIQRLENFLLTHSNLSEQIAQIVFDCIEHLPTEFRHERAKLLGQAMAIWLGEPHSHSFSSNQSSRDTNDADVPLRSVDPNSRLLLKAWMDVSLQREFQRSRSASCYDIDSVDVIQSESDLFDSEAEEQLQGQPRPRAHSFCEDHKLDTFVQALIAKVDEVAGTEVAVDVSEAAGPLAWETVASDLVTSEAPTETINNATPSNTTLFRGDLTEALFLGHFVRTTAHLSGLLSNWLLPSLQIVAADLSGCASSGTPIAAYRSRDQGEDYIQFSGCYCGKVVESKGGVCDACATFGDNLLKSDLSDSTDDVCTAFAYPHMRLASPFGSRSFDETQTRPVSLGKSPVSGQSSVLVGSPTSANDTEPEVLELGRDFRDVLRTMMPRPLDLPRILSSMLPQGPPGQTPTNRFFRVPKSANPYQVPSEIGSLAVSSDSTLIQTASEFLFQQMDSTRHQFPLPLRLLLACVRSATTSDENVSSESPLFWCGSAALLLLRLVCPAIVSPAEWGVFRGFKGPLRQSDGSGDIALERLTRGNSFVSSHSLGQQPHTLGDKADVAVSPGFFSLSPVGNFLDLSKNRPQPAQGVTQLSPVDIPASAAALILIAHCLLEGSALLLLGTPCAVRWAGSEDSLRTLITAAEYVVESTPLSKASELLAGYAQHSRPLVEPSFESIFESSASRKTLVMLAKTVQRCANLSCLPETDLSLPEGGPEEGSRTTDLCDGTGTGEDFCQRQAQFLRSFYSDMVEVNA